MKRIILITGGVGSGKSSFALKKAEEIEKKWENIQSTKIKKVFIATEQPLDEEMKNKIKKHKNKRKGKGWTTKEEPLFPQKYISSGGIIIFECLTTWVANLVVRSHDNLQESVSEFIQKIKKANSVIIIVTNEVGLGVIPESSLARRYLEELTDINRRVAEISDEVYFMVSGIPLRIK